MIMYLVIYLQLIIIFSGFVLSSDLNDFEKFFQN